MATAERRPATVTPDAVFSLDIKPGSLAGFLESLGDGGPRLKCWNGSVTLVSPGRSHESTSQRLSLLIISVCSELGIGYTGLRSTTIALPPGGADTAYEPDQSYYVQSHATAEEGQVPDLAIEVVVTNPEKKTLACGAALGIPELWVLDIPRRRLTFHRLITRGPSKGTYRPQTRSEAFPFLLAREVLDRLDDPARNDLEFHRHCREWARTVLAPRWRAGRGD